MASLTRFVSSSRVLACVWQPGKSGTEATQTPSSSFSTMTANFKIDHKTGIVDALTKNHSSYPTSPHDGILKQD
jgi:hypothetical protein